MLKAAIPSLAPSFNMLVLHRNHLEVLPDVRFRTRDGRGGKYRPPLILLHQNLLSCHLPKLQKITATLSLAALGNQFWRPTSNFPKWIDPMEQDALFFVSINEGQILVLKVFAGASLFWSMVLTRPSEAP